MRWSSGGILVASDPPRRAPRAAAMTEPSTREPVENRAPPAPGVPSERPSFRVRLQARIAERARRRIARRQARARDDLDRAVLEMAAGRWKDSEELATRTAANAVSPATHWLLAARAAELQGAVSRRNDWLARAREASADEPG